jgi:hypothetical protein
VQRLLLTCIELTYLFAILKGSGASRWFFPHGKVAHGLSFHDSMIPVAASRAAVASDATWAAAELPVHNSKQIHCGHSFLASLFDSCG